MINEIGMVSQDVAVVIHDSNLVEFEGLNLVQIVGEVSLLGLGGILGVGADSDLSGFHSSAPLCLMLSRSSISVESSRPDCSIGVVARIRVVRAVAVLAVWALGVGSRLLRVVRAAA
ncbi:hypothetical protein CsSME_00032827 [Camellia sinensis var. sinensis]